MDISSELLVLIVPAVFTATGYVFHMIVHKYSERSAKRKEEVVLQVRNCIMEIYIASNGGDSTKAFLALKMVFLIAGIYLNRKKFGEFMNLSRSVELLAKKADGMVDAGVYLILPVGLLSLILRGRVDSDYIVQLVMSVSGRFDDDFSESIASILD